MRRNIDDRCAAPVSTVVGIRRPLVSELHARPRQVTWLAPIVAKANGTNAGPGMSSEFLRGYREHSPLGAGRPTVQPLATTASCATRKGGRGGHAKGHVKMNVNAVLFEHGNSTSGILWETGHNYVCPTKLRRLRGSLVFTAATQRTM